MMMMQSAKSSFCLSITAALLDDSDSFGTMLLGDACPQAAVRRVHSGQPGCVGCGVGGWVGRVWGGSLDGKL